MAHQKKEQLLLVLSLSRVCAVVVLISSTYLRSFTIIVDSLQAYGDPSPPLDSRRRRYQFPSQHKAGSFQVIRFYAKQPSFLLNQEAIMLVNATFSSQKGNFSFRYSLRGYKLGTTITAVKSTDHLPPWYVYYTNVNGIF